MKSKANLIDVSLTQFIWSPFYALTWHLLYYVPNEKNLFLSKNAKNLEKMTLHTQHTKELFFPSFIYTKDV